MIPLKIQLKNFLSYGPQAPIIDFSPYQLICLSGKNGHGKSALLDAITWALWGQARKTSSTTKADEGLLRLGQTQMFVAFDFIFNGQQYRVRREFAKTYGKPHAALDFGIIDPDTNAFIALTDKTIRQTQAKLEQLLNLDIDSFINSAFLRQGQSNEFSKKSAKDRKNILATILGLNRFETIRTAALEKARHAAAQKEQMCLLHAKIEQELTAKQQIVDTIAATATQLQQYETQEQQLQREQQELAIVYKKLTQEQIQKQLLTDQYTQLIKQQDSAQKEIRSQLADWRIINKKMHTLPDIAQLEQQKQIALAKRATQQTLLAQHLSTKEQILKKKELLQAVATRFHETFSKQVTEKKNLVDQGTIALNSIKTALEHQNSNLQRINQELKQHQEKKDTATKQQILLQKTVTQHSAVEKRYERRKEYYQRFIAQGVWTKQELEALDHKHRLVTIQDDPSCPLCDQHLTANRKKYLKKGFDEQEQLLRHRINRLKKVTLSLQQLLAHDHQLVVATKKAAHDREALTAQLTELEKGHVTLSTCMQEETARYKQLQEQQKLQLTAHTNAQQALHALISSEQSLKEKDAEYALLMQEIQQLERTLKDQLYDPAQHQLIETTLSKIEQQCAEYASIKEQTIMQEQRKTAIHDLCTRLKALRAETKTTLDAVAQYKALDAALRTHTEQEQTHTQRAQEIKQKKEMLLQQKGGLEKQLQQCVQLEQELATRAHTLTALNSTIDDYQAIATATGKDGIQALLIEEAIPEIEQEANALLSKLTNNQAQLFIESVRDLKSGGTKETLDIKISDPIGIRPYEMFSGGEAFRIDFALRIAMSKLLARRAGTSLQTLIIDEGFGSQDEEGLSTIMDALYKIQDDFAKIIIVSHLPAMKDQFPVHFLVEKGPNGSNVRVLEQG